MTKKKERALACSSEAYLAGTLQVILTIHSTFVHLGYAGHPGRPCRWCLCVWAGWSWKRLSAACRRAERWTGTKINCRAEEEEETKDDGQGGRNAVRHPLSTSHDSGCLRSFFLLPSFVLLRIEIELEPRGQEIQLAVNTISHFLALC